MIQMRPEMGRIIEAPSPYKAEQAKQHPETAKMDAEPPLPPVGPSSLNCLRCRHCALLPHTDMSRALDPGAGVPIRCNKSGRNRPAHIFEPCPIADPRPTFVRLPSGTYDGPRGDRTRSLSPVEKAFLRAHYETGDRKLLCKLMGRGWHGIRQQGPLLGLTRDPDVVIRNRVKGRMEAGTFFNQAQREYLRRCKDTRHFPRQGMRPRNERAAEEALRQEIMDELGRLGKRPPKWKSVLLATRFC